MREEQQEACFHVLPQVWSWLLVVFLNGVGAAALWVQTATVTMIPGGALTMRLV